MHKRVRENEAGAVAPLVVCTKRTVRFEEVDALAIMWHGRYASWLEDGRECLGAHFGIRYLDFKEHGVLVPIKLFQLDFCLPLTYAKTYTIETSLLWNPAALLDFSYRIFDEKGSLTTKGRTTQLMLLCDGSLCLEQPDFYQDFCDRWRNGALNNEE